MDKLTLNKSNKLISAITLVLANTYPIFAVIFLNWQIQDILMLYWLETIVIGVFNVLKILTVKTNFPWYYRLPVTNFFISHFFSFSLGHGIFIITINRIISSLNNQVTLPVDNLDGLQLFLPYLSGLTLLFISHGLSYISNFLVAGERNKTNLSTLFHLPYNRILVMHLTIIIGTFISVILCQPTGFVIVLVGMKILVDLKSHLKEHVKLNQQIPNNYNLSKILESNSNMSNLLTKGPKFIIFIIIYLFSIIFMFVFLGTFARAFFIFFNSSINISFSEIFS